MINEIAWFSKPIDFNDPFDCGVQVDEGRIGESVRKAVQDAYVKVGKNPQDIPGNEFDVKDEDKKAFDDFQKSIYDLTQSFGIFSMSAVNDDILMWSHYADSHRGFCIEYSRTPRNILGKQAEPVKYQDRVPSLSVQEITSRGGNFDKLWLTKSIHWEYEKEWRLINTEGGKSFQFPCEIKSIIFGLKMREQNRYTIRRILENRGVLFREAVIEKGRFALRINDVTA